LYSTHYLNEVETLDASVSIIERGQVIARGSVGDLISAHAKAAVELTFEGDPPDISIEGQIVRADSRLTILSDNAASTAAEALSALGSHANQLVSVQIINPSLESVFLTLTGRRFDHEDGPVPQEEAKDVAKA
ncbi:MAG: ABC transporter ATP-binding protein, partial [Actinomycetota bacterium]